MQREQQVEVRWEGTGCIQSRKIEYRGGWSAASKREGHSTCYLALKWASMGRCGSLLSLMEGPGSDICAPPHPGGGLKQH